MIDYKLVNDVKIINKDDIVVRSSDKRNSNLYEPESFEVWNKYTIPGTISIDIGAYTGIYSIKADKNGSNVFSFEPNTVVYERFLKNIKLNDCKNIEAFNIGISDKESNVFLSQKESTRLTSGATVKREQTEENDIPIAIKPLNNFHFFFKKNVSIMKIDVEGHEGSVLLGSSEIINAHKPIIIIEIFDKNKPAVFDILYKLGYKKVGLCETNIGLCETNNFVFSPV